MKFVKNIKLPQVNKAKALKAVLLLVIVGLIGLSAYFIVLAQKRAQDIADLSATEIAESNQSIQQKVVLFGDTQDHNDGGAHQKIVDAVYKLNPVAIFHLGDAVDDGSSTSQWQTFNSIETKLIDNFNFYVAAVNHDKEASLYYNNFELPGNEKWYSVNYLGIHWVIINSNLDLMPGSEQYTWLENDLAKAREKIEHTAVLMHKNLYTSTSHYADDMPYKDSLIALLEKYQVNFVFAGHAHAYERSYSNGVYYLVCSSAGANLRDAVYENTASQEYIKSYNYCVVENNGGDFSLKAYNENSEEIDSFTVSPAD